MKKSYPQIFKCVLFLLVTHLVLGGSNLYGANDNKIDQSNPYELNFKYKGSFESLNLNGFIATQASFSKTLLNDSRNLKIAVENLGLRGIMDCPTNIIVDATPGICGAVVTWPIITSNNSARTIVRTTSYDNGDTFPVGITTVTYHELNGAAVTDTCSFTVTVVDKENPTASNPVDISVQCLTDVPTPDVTVVTDESDNCALPVVTHVGDSANPATNDGSIVRTYRVTDGSGNFIDVVQNIVIDDITAPNTPVLADVTGECTATATIPTTSDNCGATISGTTSDALTYNTQGTHTITWNFDDGNGNDIDVTQDVIIDDVTPPNTPVLADVTGECTATATIPTIMDNCGATISGTTSDPLTYSTQGTHTITWNFDDGNGNDIDVTQDVIIDDVTPPNTPVLADVTGECTATATIPTIMDNCGATISGTTSDPLTYSTQGTHTITWNFDDGNGNDIDVTQDVIIDDITPPNTPVLADVTGECTATATIPTTSDNCGATISGTTSDALTYNTQGTHTITWNFNDGNGNDIDVDQNVIIDDVTAPVAPVLADVTGECSATAAVPTTTDNCGATITGTTSDALTYNTQGTHTITWNFDDGNGNDIDVNQNVIIDDVTPPNTPVLADVTGECTATATIPTTSDNCGATISGTTSDPLTYSTQGTHTITWNFDDGNGNDIDVTQDVIIDDVTPPNTVVLADVTGECTATATIPTIMDNCGATISGTTSDPLTYSTQGTHTITWNFDDGNGNDIDVTQDVIIDDITPPNTPVLADVTGECTATATIPTTSDNCGATITGTTSDPLTYSTQGTHTITWNFDDGNGNDIDVDQNVIIDDVTAPVAPVLADITGECSATATVPTTTDNCGATITGTTSDPLTYSTQGTHTITWNFDDGNGNDIDVTQDVIIDDITPPNTPVLADVTGECTATATIPTTSDNCGATITGTTSDPLTYSTQGTHTITWNFNDGNGNSVNVDQDVIIDDITPPNTVVLADVTGECTATATIPTTMDNCGATISGTTSDPLTYSTQGTHTITWNFDDGNGNSINVNQNVIVDDTINPVTPTLANVNVGQCSGTPPTPTTTDACAGTITGTTTTVFPITTQGITVVTWNFNDGNGNSINVNQNVIVDDTINPVTPTLANVNVGQCSGTPPTPTTTDACAGTITGTTTTVFPITTQGTTVVTWNFNDGNGNSINVNQNVIVDDTINPVTPTLANVNVGQCSGTPPTPTTTDACAGTITGTTTTVFPITTQGTTVVTWNFDDGNGNSINVNQNVIVDDTINPVTPTLTNVNVGQCSGTPPTPTTTDACVGTITGTTTTVFPITTQGTTVVTWNFNDGNGNSINVNQNVIVDDTVAPVPNVTTLPTITGQCSATVTAPRATDNCKGQITGTTTSPTSYTSQGTYNITWSYNDNNGNISTQTQTVIVDDTVAPVPNVATLPTITGQCSATVTAPRATDNCRGQIIGTTTSPTSYTSQGTYNITWSYNDNNGNISTQTQTIIVDDTTAPVANIASLPTITNQCSATVTAPRATDNCSGQIIGTTSSPTSYTAQGTYTIVWTYDDNNGNISYQAQTIIIEDIEDPVTPTLPDLFAECSLTVVPPTTTDNCDAVITGTTGLSSLTFDVVGTDIIYWAFTDTAGNSITVPQNITITDAAPVPDLSTLEPQVFDGCQIVDINFLEAPTATDGCDGEITGTLSSNFVFPYSFSGTQTIDWEFIDSHGNVTIQSQDITLNPLPVTGGTINGTFESTVFSDVIDISSCEVAITIQLNLSGEIGTIVQWEKYAVNDGIWEIITDTDDSYTASFAIGALESTYYRVLVQTGTCIEYSNQFLIRALPVGSAPIITNLDNDAMYCLGEEVSLLATSTYTATQETIPDSSGDFNQGQLNTRDPDGWLVDGDPGGFTAGGSATKPRNWSAKTCNNQPNGSIVYCSNEGKYTIAYGNYSSNQYNGAIPTTLETPILDFTNAETASLDFDQAYYFAINDYANIEISTDGGATYGPLRLMHAPGSPSVNWFTAGTAESVVGSTATQYNFETDNTSIDLSTYLGQNNIRIKWSFTGTTDNSVWAMDNIFVNKTVVVDTEIEWTDGIGDPNEPPIAGGTTQVEFEFMPDAPGHHQYGTTALVNNCRTYNEDGTALIDIYVSHAYAGENVAYLNQDCGQNTVRLNAYDNRITARENANKGAFTLPANCVNCDDEGTGENGVWSIAETSACGGGTFSDVNDPDALFTAEAGTYTLTWTVAGCGSSITVTTTNCNQIDFDGTNDYVDFDTDNFHFNNGSFSIEAWVKPEVISGNQTIFSKRNDNGNNSGYDLSVDGNGIVSFNSNQSGAITSAPYRINTDRWYHIAVTYASPQYKLYIDGVLIKQNTGTSPSANTFKALLGAVDSNSAGGPKKYFNGWIDEFRIWNVGLSEDQLHQMMNQKIISSPTVAGNVQGEIIPVDVNGLTWSNLSAYFQMETSQLACGYLESTSSSIKGRLKNISSNQTQTAPIPYTSAANGQWDADNTWTYPAVWDVPNSVGVNGSRIDWNIVRTNYNIISNNKDLTLLGLFVDDNELTITGTGTQDETSPGTGLWVTHYLKINGKIDLVGESQLVQKRYKSSQIGDSYFDSTSTGYIERDQQGTGNPFNYNYWGSPVAPGNALVSGNNESTNTFTIGNVLRDGTVTVSDPINRTISWTANQTAISASPIQISTRWLYTYANRIQNTYSAWVRVGDQASIDIGLSFIMKGSGKDIAPFNGTTQNYVFVGKPNNGTISNSVSAGNSTLVGNPYPSAIDGNAFIDDNGPSGTNSITGALYFWDHYPTNNTHVFRNYQGGYAAYSKSGANAGVRPPATTDDLEIIFNGNGTKTPERYIPVGQGFSVNASNAGGGKVQFKNSQRIFKREAVTGAINNGSVFFRGTNSNANATDDAPEENLIQRVRLEFKTPQGARRPLLLSFVSNGLATDEFDYGYDAPNIETFPDDLSWLINDEKFVIQGVGNFDVDKQYPLDMYLSNTGQIEIALTALENFETDIDVYVYDALLGTYTKINDGSYSISLDSGDYANRYYIAFREDTTLSEIEKDHQNILVNYLQSSKEIYVKTPESIQVKQVYLINLIGQTVKTWNSVNMTISNEMRIPVNGLADGTYILKVQTDNASYNKKVIIKH